MEPGAPRGYRSKGFRGHGVCTPFMHRSQHAKDPCVSQGPERSERGRSGHVTHVQPLLHGCGGGCASLTNEAHLSGVTWDQSEALHPVTRGSACYQRGYPQPRLLLVHKGPHVQGLLRIRP